MFVREEYIVVRVNPIFSAQTRFVFTTTIFSCPGTLYIVVFEAYVPPSVHRHGSENGPAGSLEGIAPRSKVGGKGVAVGKRPMKQEQRF